MSLIIGLLCLLHYKKADQVQLEINVFIASPDDVRPERNIVEKVCHQLDETAGKNISVNPVRWENHPQSYHQDAQANINTHLPPSECDIVIVIFWQRFGTYLPDNYTGSITGDSPVTGTQWEFEEALVSGKPTIHFYLKESDPDAIRDSETRRQYSLLNTFLKKIGIYRGNAHHGFHEFATIEEFHERLYSHLKVEVEKAIRIKRSIFYRRAIIKWLLSALIVVGVLLGWLYNDYEQTQTLTIPRQEPDAGRSKTVSRIMPNQIRTDINLTPAIKPKQAPSMPEALKESNNDEKRDRDVKRRENLSPEEQRSYDLINFTYKVSKIAREKNKKEALKEIHKVIRQKLFTTLKKWNQAYNERNESAILGLYEKKIVFNMMEVNSRKYIKSIIKNLRGYKGYYQSLQDIKVKRLNTHIYKLSFKKRIHIKGTKKAVVLSYLIFDTSDFRQFRVFEEGQGAKFPNGFSERPYWLSYTEAASESVYKGLRIRKVFDDNTTYHLGRSESEGWVSPRGICHDIDFLDPGSLGMYVLKFSSYSADAVGFVLNGKHLWETMKQEKNGINGRDFWTDKWMIYFDKHREKSKNTIAICSRKAEQGKYDHVLIRNIKLYKLEPSWSRLKP